MTDDDFERVMLNLTPAQRAFLESPHPVRIRLRRYSGYAVVKATVLAARSNTKEIP